MARGRCAILFARHVVAEPRKALALTTDDAEQGSSQPRPGRARVTRATVMTVALTFLVLGLTGCTNNSFTRLGFPNPITEQGKTTLTLWQGSWIAGLAVGAVVWGLILWAVIFHRKRGDKLGPQARYNMPIEIMYTAVPFVLIAVLFYFTAKDEDYIDKLPAKPAVRVQVPEFLFKRDVIPGHPNHFTITATKTGTYTGHCSELCGLYHAKMLFTLKVVTPQQFQAYMAQEQAAQSSSGSTQ